MSKYLTRNSPPFSAKDYPNQIKKGNDNLNYVSIKDKNNVYKWIKYIDTNMPEPNKYKDKVYIAEDSKYYFSQKNKDNVYFWKELKIKIKKNPDQFYRQFPNYTKPINDITFFTSKIDKLKNDLKKIGILFFVLKWNKESLYAGHKEFVLEKTKEYLKENKYPNGYIFTSEFSLYGDSLSKDNAIYLYHNIKNESKDDLNKILTSYFPNKTNGLVYKQDAIIINITNTKLKPIKPHIKFVVYIKYMDKTTISVDDFTKVHKYITKKIGKKYIYDLTDAYNSSGLITLFYEVYTDKIIEFAKKFKDIKIPYLPKIKFISIAPNDMNGDKKLTWKYEYN